MNKAVLALVAILVLPGCVTEDNATELGDSQGDEEELQGLNIVAQTLGRDIDVAPTYDLLRESGNNSTLILWAAAGCKGCHNPSSTVQVSTHPCSPSDPGSAGRASLRTVHYSSQRHHSSHGWSQ